MSAESFTDAIEELKGIGQTVNAFGMCRVSAFFLQPAGEPSASADFYPGVPIEPHHPFGGRPTDLGKKALRLDSGVDIPTSAEVTIPAGATVKVKLGVRARCVHFENGKIVAPCAGVPYSAFDLRARSSVGKKGLMLANGVGTIDIGYTGELCAYFFNSSGADYTVAAGESLVQLVGPGSHPGFYVFQEPGNDLHFGPTERAAGGFGSTDAQ